MNFTELAIEEAAFILNVLGKLPTESNAFPLFKRLEMQFNDHQAKQAQPEAPVVEVE